MIHDDFTLYNVS